MIFHQKTLFRYLSVGCSELKLTTKTIKRSFTCNRKCDPVSFFDEHIATCIHNAYTIQAMSNPYASLYALRNLPRESDDNVILPLSVLNTEQGPYVGTERVLYSETSVVSYERSTLPPSDRAANTEGYGLCLKKMKRRLMNKSRKVDETLKTWMALPVLSGNERSVE